MRSVWLIFLLAAIAGCEEPADVTSGCPACFRKLIRKEEPLEVWRYRLEGKDVYLVIPDCCDQFINLFDTNCELICSPSGGFSGRGDGKCPDFYKEAIGKELVWESQ